MEGTKITLRPRKKARIEIIPLIDVIFFLLATFVLFTLSLNRIQSIPIDLPFSDSAPHPEKPDITTIQVSADGALYWDTVAIDMQELPIRIATLVSQKADPKVMLASDDRARFGATVAVLDEIRKAGITKFSVETRTRPTGR